MQAYAEDAALQPQPSNPPDGYGPGGEYVFPPIDCLDLHESLSLFSPDDETIVRPNPLSASTQAADHLNKLLPQLHVTRPSVDGYLAGLAPDLQTSRSSSLSATSAGESLSSRSSSPGMLANESAGSTSANESPRSASANKLPQATSANKLPGPTSAANSTTSRKRKPRPVREPVQGEESNAKKRRKHRAIKESPPQPALGIFNRQKFSAAHRSGVIQRALTTNAVDGSTDFDDLEHAKSGYIGAPYTYGQPMSPAPKGEVHPKLSELLSEGFRLIKSSEQ